MKIQDSLNTTNTANCSCKTANVYINAVPKGLLDEISKSTKVSYNEIDKKLNRSGLKMRVRQLRSFYATTIREKGLLSEQIDLIQAYIFFMG